MTIVRPQPHCAIAAAAGAVCQQGCLPALCASQCQRSTRRQRLAAVRGGHRSRRQTVMLVLTRLAAVSSESVSSTALQLGQRDHCGTSTVTTMTTVTTVTTVTANPLPPPLLLAAVQGEGYPSKGHTFRMQEGVAVCGCSPRNIHTPDTRLCTVAAP